MASPLYSGQIRDFFSRESEKGEQNGPVHYAFSRMAEKVGTHMESQQNVPKCKKGKQNPVPF
jgi:hypothetical protein